MISTLLFDTASLYFRAFYGLPESLRAPDGRPVNAVRGLLDFVARFVDQYRPDAVAMCWDDDWRPAWRVALVPSYKAHRVAYGDVEEVPEALTAQVPLIRAVLDTLGLPIVGHAGYEADDIITTLAARASGSLGVVTGDRDLFQVVDDARAHEVLYVARGVAKHERVTDAWLQAKYGITGSEYVDFAVLRGDPSDGLPGVKGVGDKSAALLVRKHGGIDGLVANAASLSPGLQRSLAASVDYLGAARHVVAGATDVPLGSIDLTVPRTPRDPARFAELVDLLNLGGAANRILAALAR